MGNPCTEDVFRLAWIEVADVFNKQLQRLLTVKPLSSEKQHHIAIA